MLLSQLFDSSYNIQSEDIQKLSTNLALVNESNIFTAIPGSKHIFSSIRGAEAQTAYILSAQSKGLLKVEGYFDIDILMYAVAKLTLK
ncbi:hypothetical protein [Pseudoalteromonas piscicida]